MCLPARCPSSVLGLEGAAQERGIPHYLSRVGSLLTLLFTPARVTDYDGASASNAEHFQGFFRGMLERGVYLPPPQYEVLFVSVAHSREDIEATVSAAHDALASL